MSLPILSKQFFAQHMPDEGFFSKWKDKAPWTNKCVPVYQWNEVLFVGCLFVPENFPAVAEKMIFVMCDQESLKSAWTEMNGTISVVAQEAKPAKKIKEESEMPEGLVLNADAGASTKSPDQEFSLQDDIVSEKEESSEESEDSVEELLELDFSEKPAVKLEVSPLSASPLKPAEPVANELNLEGLNETPVATPVETKVAALKPVAKPIAQSAASSDPMAHLLINKPEVKAPAPEKILPENAEVTMISVKSLKNESSLDKFFNHLFSEMGHHYLKTMLLLKDGETMKPYRWDEKFQSSHDSATVNGIALNTPSPWRIVMRTQKPYHGYVANNEISDAFFDSWNSALSPEHMTLVPVIVEDHVIGMILGLGEKSADNKNCLHLTENLANEISTQIRSQPDFFKAA